MAKNTVYEWDPVAANNTDIAGINIQGSAAVSNFDNAFRTSMAQIKSGVDYKQVYAVKTGNYTALAIDNNAFHNFTGATPTLSLTAAATLGANWHYDGYSTGGPVIIDPNASELINGATTITVPQYCGFSIKCDGSAFVCVFGTAQTMAQATIKGRASGAGTGTPTDLTAADVFAILGSLVPAKPISGAGVGQWTSSGPGLSNGLQLPAGGTWAAAWLGFNASGNLTNGLATTVAAGGTTIQTAVGSVSFQALYWRIA